MQKALLVSTNCLSKKLCYTITILCTSLFLLLLLLQRIFDLTPTPRTVIAKGKSKKIPLVKCRKMCVSMILWLRFSYWNFHPRSTLIIAWHLYYLVFITWPCLKRTGNKEIQELIGWNQSWLRPRFSHLDWSCCNSCPQKVINKEYEKIGLFLLIIPNGRISGPSRGSR